jgi:hypothetical protein
MASRSERRKTAFSAGRGSRRIGERPWLGSPHTIDRLLSAAVIAAAIHNRAVIQTDTKP